jgi:hypothetical protein
MTQCGKQQSRRNAMRHGLTAATVVTAIEDSQEFERFEAPIRADYQPVCVETSSSNVLHS